MKIKLLILNSFLLAYFVTQSANLRAAGSESKEKKETKATGYGSLTIFGENSYHQIIQEFKKNLAIGTAESLTQALDNLEFIKGHAMNDILNNIPLRVYLAAYNLYPINEINSDNPVAYLNIVINHNIGEIKEKIQILRPAYSPGGGPEYDAYIKYLANCTAKMYAVKKHLGPPGLTELVHSYDYISFVQWLQRLENNEKLFKAVKNNNIEEIKKLLGSSDDVDVNVRESVGKSTWTPLMWAVTPKGSIDLVKLLISHGADVNKEDSFDEMTPLMIAAMHNPEIVKLLLSKGANINAKDIYGNTALSNAISKNQAEIVKILRESGVAE